MKKFKNIKLMSMLVMLMVFALVISSCTAKSDESNMKDEIVAEDMSSEESMDKEDDMVEDSMDKEDDMVEDSMNKEDAMGKEDMGKEETMDEDKSMEEKMEETMMTNDGKRAPEFELMDKDGNVVTLESFEGKKVYVKYWASWCSICLAGFEELDELFAGDEEFEMITVVMPGVYGEKDKDDFIEWYEGLDYKNVTVYFDEEAEFGNQLGIRAFPTSVYIGSDGVLISVEPGHKSNDQIRDKVASFY